MARAKRTDRTEARRRYRAEQAVVAAAEPDASDGTAGTASAKVAPAAKAAPAPGERPSVMSSFRAAYRPPNILDDLKHAKDVFLNIGWIGTMVGTLAIVVWFIIVYNPGMEAIPVGTATVDNLQKVVGDQGILYFLGTNALQPPPIIGAFIIGFTAKRASWLGGLTYGIWTTILFIVLLQFPAGRLMTGDKPGQPYIVQMAALAPLGGALFASALAWYRRFLQLASPNRQAQQRNQKAKTPKQKAVATKR